MLLDVVLVAAMDAGDDLVAAAAAEAARVLLAFQRALDHPLEGTLDEGEVREVVLGLPHAAVGILALGALGVDHVGRLRSVPLEQPGALFGERLLDRLAIRHWPAPSLP